jgi:hypothetical protein
LKRSRRKSFQSPNEALAETNPTLWVLLDNESTRTRLSIDANQSLNYVQQLSSSSTGLGFLRERGRRIATLGRPVVPEYLSEKLGRSKVIGPKTIS